MALGIEWDVENWAEKINETQEKGQPETGYLGPVLKGRCKKQSQPNWESSQEVHTKEPRKTQNSCRKISEWRRRTLVLLYYEWVMRCLKSYTHTKWQIQRRQTCQMFQWPLHQPKRKCPQWPGSTENCREPRSPTSHTVKAFNTRQSFSLVRVSYWYLRLRWYSASIDLLWSLANNDSLCSFALY